MTDIRTLLEEHIRSCATPWHLGTFGVVAEFMRDEGEPVVFPADGGLGAYTDRGAIRLEATPDLTLFAYETATSRAKSWSQQVALCLPRGACAMNRRRVVTALGPDREAAREGDRPALLFDLGLDRMQMDALIRTEDDALIAALTAVEGKSLFDFSNGALAAIFKAQPHRVFVTRFGRVEVFQPIPADGSTSPPGPHTHLLPKLMKTGRTHGANAPIPKNLVPGGGFAPSHPLRATTDRTVDFDIGRHTAFQALLERFGDRRLVSVKQAAAYDDDDDDDDDALKPVTRHERTAARVGALQRRLLADA